MELIVPVDGHCWLFEVRIMDEESNDMTNHSHRRIAVHFLASAAVAVLVLGIPAVVSRVSPAQAQGISISVEFRDALEPYGHWRKHSRWGEVWIPRHSRGWQPYRNGHWVYTDEWGWYWVADRNEGNWGWVAYHYGRWVLDPDEGWIWIPGREWAPAWVDWRRGADYVGWSPLPPDDYVVETRENPEFWLFVRPGNLVAPVLGRVYLPSRQTNIYIQNTVIVNRTVVVQSSGAALRSIQAFSLLTLLQRVIADCRRSKYSHAFWLGPKALGAQWLSAQRRFRQAVLPSRAQEADAPL